MGGRERNPNPAFQAFVTGIYAPTAEGGTAFFSPRLPPLFLFACVQQSWTTLAGVSPVTVIASEPCS